MIHALIYIAAVVAANVSSIVFGPSASVFNAFAFIGVTLTTRDVLQERFGKGAALGLMVLGSVLTLLIGGTSGAPAAIVKASVVAFFCSELLDLLVYHLARRHPWLVRSNVSNVAGAAVDSLIFPTIAFGGFMLPIVLGQFVAKTLGGAIWSFIVKRRQVLLPLALVAAAALPAKAQQARPPRFMVQAQVGTAHYPFNQYSAVGNAGLNVLVFLPGRFSLLGVLSRDVVPGAKPVGIVALQYRLFAR